jgi:hypothetical protein
MAPIVAADPEMASSGQEGRIRRWQAKVIGGRRRAKPARHASRNH